MSGSVGTEIFKNGAHVASFAMRAFGKEQLKFKFS
jgi:hypothetical protein